MDSGKLNTRITVKRLTNTSDGYGGTTSTIADYKTFWAKKKEVSGEIMQQNGTINRYIQIELIIRKRTADEIRNNDILQVEGSADTYRVNSIHETRQDFYKMIKATKID